MESNTNTSDFKPSNYNPWNNSQTSKPEENKYLKPDPSKSIDCGQDRPIKFNPTGKYNLNFIDYDNEFEAVCEAKYNLTHGIADEDPIYGMDAETFEAILTSENSDYIANYYGVKPEFYRKFPIMEATKVSDNNMCAICIKHYHRGCKVFFLPCKHNFHIECIMPWFKGNSVCPNCRFDLNGEEDGDLE